MTPRPWADPELTSRGRLPMHAVPHDDRVPLDGTWRFQLLHHPTDQVDGAAWRDIAVPGVWTMQDTWDHPIYTNVQMPFPHRPPATPEENPTGIYERSFEVPAAWSGRRVVLHVGAAESVLLVELNGQDVGISKDSHLAAEFDVTSFLRPGANDLRLTVVKWSDASFVEDQDQWWHGGITRPVYLYATAQAHLADLVVDAGLDEDLSTGTLGLEVGVDWGDAAPDAGWRVEAEVDGLADRLAADVPWRLPKTEGPGDWVVPGSAAARDPRPPEPRGRRSAHGPRRRRSLARGRADHPAAEHRAGAARGADPGRGAVVAGGPEPVHAARLARRARRHRGGARRAPDRVPARRDPRRRAPPERATGDPAWRQPPRVRPPDGPRHRSRGHAGRRHRDEALELQRGPDVALPRRPPVPRPVRRARAVGDRRGQHRVARLVQRRVPRPPLPARVRRPGRAHDRARPPPPLDHRVVTRERVRLRRRTTTRPRAGPGASIRRGRSTTRAR